MLALASFVHWMVLLLFGYERLSPLDELFILDSSANPANIIACVILKKAPIEKFYKQFRDRGYKFRRLRSKLVKVFGDYYWVEMDPIELAA